ncbi:MAG: BatA and WFA domain-containing protein [Candidatus Latescibacter sp.]|nr:BatA and WFA domain-containing protein [Candidatus Latescibacter sp.]
MNFLNSIILLGMGAALLPLLIHLFSRRRAVDVSFPSIEFLERMKTDRMRRLRLKQLLMLLLRTLIIIMVILAFARPAIRSIFQKNAHTSAVIIIDSSASMLYAESGESLFASAIRKTEEILSLLRDEDTAAVILSGGAPATLGTGLTKDRKELVKALSGARNSGGVNRSSASFRKAFDLLAASTAPNREIYYLTDGAVNALPDSMAEVKNVRLYNILIGPAQRNGAVIEDITLSDYLLSPGKKNRVTAEGSLGPEDTGAGIEFFVNSERKGRTEVQKSSGSRVKADFEYTPENPGWYSIWATAADGRFEPGETRRMVVHVPRKTNILICGGAADDLFFPERALSPDPENPMFAIRTRIAPELTESDLTGTDVVILTGVKTLPVPLYRRLLTDVVDRGAGLLVFPAMEMDPALYTDGIFRDLFPARVDKRITLDGKQANYAVMEWFNLGHPILQGISPGGKFQRPEVRSYLRIIPVGDISVMARFGDGSMAAGSAACGKGKVIVFGVDASRGSSDLPLTGIFLPLFIRSVQYLSGSFVLGGHYETGDPLHETLGDVSPSGAVTLKPENGLARSVETVRSGNAVTVTGESAGDPGFYALFADGSEKGRFCVDIPRSEVRFERADSARMSKAYRNLTWKALDESENIARAVTQDRYGKELFGLFIVIAVALLGVEMVVARKV